MQSFWQARSGSWEEYLHARHRVADGQVLFQSLGGRTRQAVIARLGEPMETEHFSDWDLVYLLGPERGLISIDNEWLVLKLDERGIVVAANVVTD